MNNGSVNGVLGQERFGQVDTRAKARKRKPANRTSRKPGKARKAALSQMAAWADRYVIPAVVLSAALNAWANVLLSPAVDAGGKIAAGVIGAVVPGLTWIAFKVAGWSYRAEHRNVALAVGAAGLCLLLLSVSHCAHAIAHLTGCGWWMGLLMAIGIDYGLVSSEVAAIVAHVDEE